MTTYKIIPGIAALVHVYCDAFPMNYGERRCAYVFLSEEKGVDTGLNEPVKYSQLPLQVRDAINQHFKRVFALNIDDRIQYMKTVQPIIVEVEDDLSA